MNVIVVQCNIIYMVFSMIWCSYYIDNLWNEGALKSIITPGVIRLVRNQCIRVAEFSAYKEILAHVTGETSQTR